MRLIPEILCLCTIMAGAASRLHYEHYKREGHSIMKRMAEMEEVFEQHEVATVHLMEGQIQRKKRMARKDLRKLGNRRITIRLQLGLSSGSKMNLVLMPVDIGNSDTVVSYHTENGYVKRKPIATDCYFYGQMEDSTGTGWAAISHCDGVFGFASTPSYEYFLHPIGSGLSKRDIGEEFDVHVLSRRSQYQNDDFITPSVGDDDTDVYGDDRMISKSRSGKKFENATEFVIELAMFSDEQFWKKLVKTYPDREDDFLLTRLAGTQAMYGDREKVGYDVKIKLKFLEYWKTNPSNYTFTEKFDANLKSFCQHTAKNYVYDLHALNTGITNWNDGQIGLAYVGGACTNKRCFVLKGTDFKSFIGFGHEMGHTLGMSHQNTANCPLKDKSKGFMGGGPSLFFAPCMGYKLSNYLKSGKGNCLFSEATESKTPMEYQSVPSLFPGQSKPPDELCQILGGAGYKYLTNKRLFGSGVCKWFICLNEDKGSPEFLRAQRYFAPIGFPCKDEHFCRNDQSCRPWNKTKMTLDPDNLKILTRIPHWTEWSLHFSPCSRSCGTGVRVRYRECQYIDNNLSPYCPGMPVIPELCNTDPCEREPTTLAELRHLRRDEVCERFFQHNVRLRLKKANAYLPTGSNITPDDIGPNIPIGHSISCLLKCVRDPKSARGELDAVMPDGTLCTDYSRPQYDLDRLKIQMRCLRGHCHEFSDCPDGRQIKDDCGICDGDGSRCFSLTVKPLDIAKKVHAELTVVPHCSRNIDVSFDRSKGTGVILELWSHDNKHIIGEGGQYPKADYEGAQAIEFAGTKWTYKPYEAYLRSTGPINETVKIKALRKGNGVKKITIKYASSV